MSTFEEFQAIVMEEFQSISEGVVRKGGGIGMSTANKDKSKPWDLHKKQSVTVNKYGKDISDTVFTNQSYSQKDVQARFPNLFGCLTYLKEKGLDIKQAADVLTSYVNSSAKSTGLVKSYYSIFGNSQSKEYADPADVIAIYNSDKNLKSEFDRI